MSGSPGDTDTLWVVTRPRLRGEVRESAAPLSAMCLRAPQSFMLPAPDCPNLWVSKDRGDQGVTKQKYASMQIISGHWRVSN